MEQWQELLRKKSLASLEVLAERFGAEHVPELERLRQAAERGGPAPIPGCFVLMWRTGLPLDNASLPEKHGPAACS